MEKYINKILNLKLLELREIKEICEKSIEILIKEPNFPVVSSPVSVCGDIHGQIFDLVGIFKIDGIPKDTKYIFLGDYVDRGEYSTECIFLLLIYKIMYPNNIFLVRGNHEQKKVCKSYGLYQEVLNKYNNIHIWRLLCEIFVYFNVGCIIDGRVLCLHGGISPKAISMDQLKRINRCQQINVKDEFEDIVWSDPHEQKGFGISTRGLGHLYGCDVTNTFLECNDLSNIIRSHQFAFEGYRFHHPDKNVVTVWGAPDYMGKFGNPGSIMRVKDDLVLNTQRLLIYNYSPRTIQMLNSLYQKD
ncbi:hypothetical protein P3W45_001057 [Vairimorpha bombi]|jgi:diadenosine tetraphosphatase ApaH/serine/threonine PP2A family protein phosphatase